MRGACGAGFDYDRRVGGGRIDQVEEAIAAAGGVDPNGTVLETQPLAGSYNQAVDFHSRILICPRRKTVASLASICEGGVDGEESGQISG